MKRKRILISVLVLILLPVLAAGRGAVSVGAERPQRPLADFDGDMYADLAIGTPYENVSSVTDAGSVSVLYSSFTGVSATGNQYWTQSLGLTGSDSEAFDLFGKALAVGDFDGDGYYDLAVGVPQEDVGSVNEAGVVNIIYGSSPDGLSTTGNQYWNENESGVLGTSEEQDHFGAALAAGDFDGDGYDDLAIGVPDENWGSAADTGAVHVLYGSSSGLTATGNQFWSQPSGYEAGDQFGYALTAGDFNGDGYGDLAVGAPSEDLVTVVDAGVVDILYGSSGGLITRVSNDLWHQDRSGIADTAEEYDFFGRALTTGDFDGDGYADLAIGVPFEDVGSPAVVNAGAVHILYGSSSGISATDSQQWHQDSPNIGSLNETSDQFGEALAAGDFDGDRYVDLAVGIPHENWNEADTGIVQVLYGSDSGLSGPDQLWRQDTNGIWDQEEAGDQFGYALAAGDFNGDAYVDLAVGVPYEDYGSSLPDGGLVHVLYGSSGGLTSTGNTMWIQGLGIEGTAESGDRFGYALAAIPSPFHRVYLPTVLKNY